MAGRRPSEAAGQGKQQGLGDELPRPSAPGSRPSGRTDRDLPRPLAGAEEQEVGDGAAGDEEKDEDAGRRAPRAWSGPGRGSTSSSADHLDSRLVVLRRVLDGQTLDAARQLLLRRRRRRRPDRGAPSLGGGGRSGRRRTPRGRSRAGPTSRRPRTSAAPTRSSKRARHDAHDHEGDCR